MQQTRERTFLRIGAVCAVLGAIVSVAAGTGFGNATNELGTEAVLRYVSSQPTWYWPLVYLGFVLGALLWVGAFVALSESLAQGTARALGRLGVASVIVGATIHVIDSSISGGGLARLADAWASAPDQASLVRQGDLLLWVLDGTWAGVLGLFHGLPFVLFGLAVVLDRGYPGWLGWLGFAGGLGSLLIGTMMFLGLELVPVWLFIVFALVVSVFMLILGFLMWRRANAAARNGEAMPEGREQMPSNV